MENAALTLVSHALCPFVQRAAIALNEKNVPFQRIDIDLKAKPDWFLAISPLGKTPLLKVPTGAGEAVLFESAVICEYLEETQDGVPLHPADPILRAQHRAWVEFASEILLGDNLAFLSAKDAETAQVKRDTMRAKFQRLETALGDGPYFSGLAFSMVDAAFAPIFRYYGVFAPEVSAPIFADLPKVAAWRSALAARPSVAAAVGPDFGDRLMDQLRQAGVLLGQG